MPLSLPVRRASRAALVFLLTGAVFASSMTPVQAATEPALGFAADPTQLVNTSIGNNGDGTTFPGAAMPFGMVQNSPDTQLGKYASYDYAQNSVLGFSQVHLSGVGCQTVGVIRFMPTTKAVTSSDPAGYASTFTHARETASPGRYQVHLEDTGVDAELSATERTGQHRYTYPGGAAQTVVVEVGRGNGDTFASEVTIVGNDTIEGHVQGGNFCGETGSDRYDVYFSAKFDRPFTSYSSWNPGTGPTAGVATQTAASGGALGAALTFDPSRSQQVRASVGLSYSSTDGARINRVTESERNGRMTSFDSLRQKATSTWSKELKRLRVSGGTTADQRTYYSALYRSLLHPSIGSDVDGRYRGLDNQIHSSPSTYYQMFSLWDTYRSQNSLVALLHPARAADMASSILAIYEQGGWLPRWSLGNGETNVMSGDPVTPFVVTLWQRGLLDRTTATKLFAALWRNATQVPTDQSRFRGRDGNPGYLKNGFVSLEGKSGYQWGDTRQAGSATLEYAYGDCMLSTMAMGLGQTAKASQLAKRCTTFTTIWDPGTSSKGFTGFPRPRNPDGSWAGPADPTQSNAFQEGTAWQYQWLTQQDPESSFALMGGRAKAEQRLDSFFDLPKVLASPATAARESWVVGAYDYHNAAAFNPNNEPDLHAPWMYAWTGSPWKTSAVMRANRALFTDTVTGMPGNDDLGTISSWLVFSMIGLFEAQPGSGTWILSAPMFDQVVITPEGGDPIRISAPGARSDQLQYISTVRLQGAGASAASTKSWLGDAELRTTKNIRIGLTTDPAVTTWGTRVEDRPPTFGPGLKGQTAVVSAALDTSVVDMGSPAMVSIRALGFAPGSRVSWSVEGPIGSTVSPPRGVLTTEPNQTTTATAAVSTTGLAAGSYPVTVTARAGGRTTRTTLMLQVRGPFLLPGSLTGAITSVEVSSEPYADFGYGKGNLVDGNPATAWAASTDAGAPVTAAVTLDQPATVTRYAVTLDQQWVSSNAAPTGVELQGSTDGNSWTTLDTRTGLRAVDGATTTVFTVAAPGAYGKYRAVFTAPPGSTLLVVSELQLSAQ